MNSTPAGIDTDGSLVQLRKAAEAIFIMPTGIEKEELKLSGRRANINELKTGVLSFLQFEKAKYSMSLTVFGIVIDVNSVQLWNA